VTEEFPKAWRRFTVGLILAGLHTALFLLVAVLLRFTSDNEAGMVLSVFYFFDHPVSSLFDRHVFGTYLGLPIFGALLWFGYGWTFQSLFWIRSPHGLRWLIASLVFLAGLFLLGSD
jgi:hypothetical protein